MSSSIFFSRQIGREQRCSTLLREERREEEHAGICTKYFVKWQKWWDKMTISTTNAAEKCLLSFSEFCYLNIWASFLFPLYVCDSRWPQDHKHVFQSQCGSGQMGICFLFQSVHRCNWGLNELKTCNIAAAHWFFIAWLGRNISCDS